MDSVFAAIGVATTAVLAVRLLIFVWSHFLSPAASFSKFKGQWAVVTGASSGIGAGFSRQLAAKGVNVALIARSVEKLTAVAADCKKHGVQTSVITFDFDTAQDSDYDALAATLTALNPRVLVNNVGVNVPFPVRFAEMDPAEVDRIVRVNVASTNKMTAMLLPKMIAERSGLVLFLSSSAGSIAPGPLLAPYTATKAYMDQFAIALSGEVSHAGVVVHSITPFFVESAMAKMRRSFTVPDADSFAKSALRAVGGSVRLSPHWPHVVMGTVLNLLPMKMQIKHVANLHESIRKRAIRKRDRLAKQG